MPSFNRWTLVALLLIAFTAAALAQQGQQQSHVPQYMSVAKTFVGLFANATPGVNSYGGDNKRLSVASARTQCASFVTLLWNYTYFSNWSATANMSAWMGTASPFAEEYHDAIENETGWTRLRSVDELMEGDVFAMRYDNASNLTVTGHVMLFVNATQRLPATAPLVPGTVQFDVWVIDSSSSYHGANDTRAPPNTPGGIGSGVARIYANATTRAIVGYTWSTSSGSEFYGEWNRTIVAGRPDYLLQRVEPTYYGTPSQQSSPQPSPPGQAPPEAWDGTQQMLVPAYFYPGAIWDQMLSNSSGRIAQVGIVIANPANGPGTSLDTSYSSYINATRSKGITVIGYVHVSYANRNLSLVLADIAKWRALYNISGFFIDETPTTASQSVWMQYWSVLNQTIREGASGGSSYIVLNPGTIPDEKFTNVSDTIVVHETYASQSSSWTPPPWAPNYPASKFCVLYHTCANASLMSAIVAKAKRDKVHYLYVTDDNMTNPWDRLPSFFDQELQQLGTTIPTPAPQSTPPAPTGITTPAPTTAATAPANGTSSPAPTTAATAPANGTSSPAPTTSTPSNGSSTNASTTARPSANSTATAVPNGTTAAPLPATTASTPASQMKQVRKRVRLSGALWNGVLASSLEQLKAAFRRDLAKILNVAESQIIVAAVTIGSLVVEYDFVAPVSRSDVGDDVTIASSSHLFNATEAVYEQVTQESIVLSVLDASTLASAPIGSPSTPLPATPTPSAGSTPAPLPDESSTSCGRGCGILIGVVVAVALIAAAVGLLLLCRSSAGTEAPSDPFNKAPTSAV